jgi:hypothetical protein
VRIPCRLVDQTFTVNVEELVAVPPGVVTEILPVVAPVGTVAVICVYETTVNVAETPLNLTFVAPVNAVPVIVTLRPTLPLVGVKAVIVGCTLNTLPLTPVPAGVVTLILPVSAPLGTVVVILVLETTVNDADVPLNLTPFVPLKLLPMIVTGVPTAPAAGLTPEIDGGGAVTVSVAVSVFPDFVPVIVYVPAELEPQAFALHVAPAEAVKLVDPVTPPREFP